MIGQTISHYKILEKLGEGGMGVVYKALDTKLDRIVALKFLPLHALSSEEDVVRFQQEAKALSSLNHPNISIIYDVDRSDEQKFIVLEYLPGGTLKSFLRNLSPSGKELSIAQITQYGLQIAEGLNHAHRRGIIHRDIKTDNMMLTEEGTVKITDFGLAKFKGTAQLTERGSTVGTVAYMSPEQIRAEQMDHRSDIFSFGTVLYELFTGRLPFRGEHMAALSYSIVNEEPMPMNSLRPSIPTSLERIISRCLAKEKEQRFQSVDEITSELQAIMKEFSGAAPAQKVVRRPALAIPLAIVATMLILGLVALYVFFPSAPAPAERKSIAVLPFKNLSEEKENEYFSDGITEDIITQLSKIGDLKVISRTSVMRYKNTDKNLRDIGNELDVAVILEGSVRRSGNRVRIVSQLIDARSDEHVWAETYDKELTEIFSIQSDVAQQIASALRAQLSSTERKRIEKKTTDNAEAYQLYLRGRFHISKTEKNELRKAIELFEQAIEKDSNYALAYSGLSDAYSLVAYFQYGDIISLPDARSRAKAAAERALEIDEELAEAHTSLGYFKRTFEYDWVGAEREFLRSIELNPNYALAYNYHALLLAALGRFDKALEKVQIAHKLNPLALDIYLTHARIYYFSRQFDKAIDQLHKAMELDSTYLKLRGVLGAVYTLKGMHREAIQEFQKSKTLTGIDFEGTENYPMPATDMEPATYWKSALDHAIKEGRHKSISGLVMATLYTRIGNNDKAIEWLNIAYDRREGGLVYLMVEPIFDPLRSDKRYALLLGKLGLQ
jgi:serine/threonine protein kinase/Tfp pilus assembly protein PilF